MAPEPGRTSCLFARLCRRRWTPWWTCCPSCSGRCKAQEANFTPRRPAHLQTLSRSTCCPPALPPMPKVCTFPLGLTRAHHRALVRLLLNKINQVRPTCVSNMILEAVWPCTKDKHTKLTGMHAENVRQLRELVRYGVLGAGTRHAVRVIASGDHEALCAVHGHNGPNARMPWLRSYSSRAPGAAQAGKASMGLFWNWVVCAYCARRRTCA